MDYHVRVDVEDGYRNVFVVADDAAEAREKAQAEATKAAENVLDAHATPLD